MGVKTHTLNLLTQAWTGKVRSMKRMDQGTNVRPVYAQEVLRIDEGTSENKVKVDCGPAVFKLCEKAGGMPTMYVVVEGWICVQQISGNAAKLQTTCFGTKVGYFRSKSGLLEHVYGVHYDMDLLGDGHPVFHAQLATAKDLASAIHDKYRLSAKVVDRVTPMLRNVRTPTAQMDFFSVFTQICADHLMARNAANIQHQAGTAFDSVRSACSMLQGLAYRLNYLNGDNAKDCYRSSHWYGGP